MAAFKWFNTGFKRIKKSEAFNFAGCLQTTFFKLFSVHGSFSWNPQNDEFLAVKS